MNEPFYITTAIPYVNALPHVGFAMELVIADVLARHHRQRGREVRFQTGADENSLKNVQAAEAEGIPTADLVARNAEAFRDLRSTLNLSWDDFIRTSSEPRHRVGAEALWRACLEAGDIYKRPYSGLYCVGCEQFYLEADLVDGKCPEHHTAPQRIEEENYFFRLSRYAPQILQAIESGALAIRPPQYRNEILAFVRSGLEDFSISRSARRGHGWGIPVPDDPEQVMYVWFDALGNYITALDEPTYERFWASSGDRVHVIGKGITRFHAIYWPAILASAGRPWPKTILVHGYLTVDGQKIGKSLGNAIDLTAIVDACGTDALRYFLCRHIRTGRDGDFSLARLRQVHDTELADGLGNLLRRTIAMITRYRGGEVPAPDAASAERPLLVLKVAADVRDAFDDGRLDDALDAAWSIVDAANRFVVDRAPWKLAKREDDPDATAALDTTLYDLAEALRLAAHHLAPFLPVTATEIATQLGADLSTNEWGALPPGTKVLDGPPLFPKRTD